MSETMFTMHVTESHVQIPIVFVLAKESRISRFAALPSFAAVIVLMILPRGCFSDDAKLSPKQSATVATESEVNDFLRQNNLSKSADFALAALHNYLARDLTAAQRTKVENQIARFEEIKKSGKVRFAGKWVEPGIAMSAAEKADQLIDQAFEKLKKRDGKGTLADLEKACKVNPDGIRAYFILGMLFSIRGNCNPYRAEDYFAEVVKRAPDYVPGLNNLALCEIKTRKYGEAFAHFRQAATLAPDSIELVQNVNRVVSEAAQKQLPVPDKDRMRRQITSRLDLFEKLAADMNAGAEKHKNRFDDKVGWLYAPYVPTKQERDADQEEQQKNGNEPGLLIPLSSGTGFAITPNLLLTNRHVVELETMGPADVIRIRLPDVPDFPPKTATILALCNHADLALLKVEGANFTPIGLSQQPTMRGREVLVLGYPRIQFFGATLKATRGVITGMEDKRFDGMLMTDAEANPGNSGGPVCDRSALLVGVLTAITQGGIGDYSFAVPVAAVHAFLKENGVMVQPANAGPAAVDWSEVDQKISQSVFLIENSFRVAPLRFRDLLPDEIRPKRSEFEDESCSWCCGRGAVRCPAVGCIGGGRPVTELYTVTLNVATVNMGNVRTQGAIGGITKTYKCNTCKGRGHVSCPLCEGKGTDPDLR